MDPLIAVPVVVFVAVLAVSYVLLTARARPNPVRRRLAEHAVRIDGADAKPLERIEVLKASAYDDDRSLAARLRRLSAAQTAERELRQADLTLGPIRYLTIRLGLALGLASVLFLVSGNPLVALGGLVAGGVVPRLAVRRIASKRRAAFEAQLAEAIDLLVGALRSGHGFLQAIESAAREMTDPMRKELLRVIEQTNVGGDAAEALQELTTRIDSADLKLLAAAIAVQRQSGGNLAEVLESLADTVRERRRIRGEVKSLTAGPRLSSYIVGLMPLGLVLYFVMVSADYRTRMLGTTLGHVMLAGAAVWTTIGFLLSQKLAKVEY
jgi:tight adherence protein B